MMQAPYEFHRALTHARLGIIADALLEVLYDTELEMVTPLDDGYTRGTATFGRQRNALIQLCQGGRHPWLKLTHAGMDLTFEIEGVPCRFFADDPANPRKPGFFRRNECDQLFEQEARVPTLFRFIVAKPQLPDDDAEVYFIGFDANLEEVFRWQYSRSTPSLVSVDDARPEEVALPPPRAKVREEDKSQEDAPSHRAAGDNHDPRK